MKALVHPLNLSFLNTLSRTLLSSERKATGTTTKGTVVGKKRGYNSSTRQGERNRSVAPPNSGAMRPRTRDTDGV
jgi:hypothetical protein